MRQLRPWQKAAMQSWLTSRRGVASVVTGAGKTTLALACMAEVRRQTPRTQVLIIVPTVALLDQWLVEVQTVLGTPRDEIATHGGGSRAPVSAPFHIAVVNSARILTPTLSAGASPWMLIADECHRYGAPANRRAIQGDWSAALGLSATPSREYDDWFEKYVVPQTGDVVYEYSYADALRDGILTPFDLTNYRVPLSSSELEGVRRADRLIARLLSRESDQTDTKLRKALFARARIVQGARARVPAARVIMRSHMGRRALIFHEQILSADMLVQFLRRDGHRAAAYHSGLGRATRQKNLLLFRTHQIDVLVTCRALDEGLDVPEAEFGLICASTSSTRQRIQRMGRLVRRAPGKSKAEIATIYALDSERDRLTSEAAKLSGLADVRWYSVEFQ